MAVMRDLAVTMAVFGVLTSCRPQLPPPVRPLVRTQDAPFRAQIPGPSSDPGFSFPAVQVRNLASGLRIVYVPWRGDETTVLYVDRRAGEVDSASVPGVATATCEMLNRFDLDPSGVGPVHPRWHAVHVPSREACGIEVDVPNGEFDEMFSSLVSAIYAPRITRARIGQVFRTIRDPNLANPSVDIGDLARMAYLGEAHPYARPVLGFRDDWTRIDERAVRTFHAGHFASQTSAVIVVSALPIEHVEARVASQFEALSPPPSVRDIVWPVPLPPREGVVVMPRGQVPLAVIGLAQRAPSRRSPDYPAAQVLARVLGRLARSRLQRTLREESGAAYASGASLLAYREGGVFSITAAVRVEQLESSLGSIREQLTRLQREAVSHDELAAAIASEREAYFGRFESRGQIARVAMENFVAGIDPTAVQAFADDLERVTASDVQRVARESFRTDRLRWAIAGDFGFMEPILRRLFAEELSELRRERQ